MSHYYQIVTKTGSIIAVSRLHSLKHRPGGWGLIPEMIQVCDYDILIVLVELYTLIYVRPLHEWQILKLGHFEVGNFEFYPNTTQFLSTQLAVLLLSSRVIGVPQ